MATLPSPVDLISVNNHFFFIKRDDEIDTCLSGNKYRKLKALIDTPKEAYNKIISYGGNQSNAMFSIACIAKEKGWHFDYYTKSVASLIKQNPKGNYKKALDLGVHFIEIAHSAWEETIQKLNATTFDGTLFIRQGGANGIARQGIKELVIEINHWKKQHNVEKLNLVTPSGTGTTALFLAAETDDTVYTTPCVGDKAYLLEQMCLIQPPPENLKILQTNKSYAFAKPYIELYAQHKTLFDASLIEFDLIYAPVMWTALFENLDDIYGTIMYIHSGGVSGNETMLESYKYKKLI